MKRRLEPGTGTPARHRNLGWRAARAPLVAFTDDDCRPEPDWLEVLLAAARRHPSAIVQGATRPDPFESELLQAIHARTQQIEPPSIFARNSGEHWAGRLYIRRASPYLTRRLIATPLTPNGVTWLMMEANTGARLCVIALTRIDMLKSSSATWP